MKKSKIAVIIIIILFVLGGVTVSISDKLFFTTEYYNSPIAAYNAGDTYNISYGDTTAQKELGYIELDEETGLFIGSINEKCFAVCEMIRKNGKYANKGMSFIWDLTMDDAGDGKESTSTSNGYVYWDIIPEDEFVNDKSIERTETFTNINGDIFYIVVYKTEDGSVS